MMIIKRLFPIIVIIGVLLAESVSAITTQDYSNARSAKTDCLPDTANLALTTNKSLDTIFIGQQVRAIENEIKAIREAYEKKSAEDRNKYKIAILAEKVGMDDWVMNALTLILLFAVGFQIRWMRKTVQQMKDDGASRDNFDKIKLRARVNIGLRPDRITAIPGPYGTLDFTFRPIITNDGETAADSIEFLAGTPFGPIRDNLSDIHVGFLDENIRGFRNNPGAITIPGMENLPFSLPKGGKADDFKDNPKRLMSQDFFSQPGKPPTIAYYAGFLKYKDIFGDIWVRKFIWQLVFNYNFTGVREVWERENSETKDTVWQATSPPQAPREPT